MQEKEIETLYPIKRNKKKRNIILISILIIIILVGTFILLKNNNLDSKNNEANENEDKIVSPPQEEEVETNDIPPNYVEYMCEKEGNNGVLDNKISYKNIYRYNFFFDWDENKVTIGKYNVDYIFKDINDYNNSIELPIIFKDKFYEEQNDEEKLTKTLIYYYKLEYENVSLDNLNSYLKSLANDKFKCKVVVEE